MMRKHQPDEIRVVVTRGLNRSHAGMHPSHRVLQFRPRCSGILLSLGLSKTLPSWHRERRGQHYKESKPTHAFLHESTPVEDRMARLSRLHKSCDYFDRSSGFAGVYFFELGGTFIRTYSILFGRVDLSGFRPPSSKVIESDMLRVRKPHFIGILGTFSRIYCIRIVWLPR